VILFIIIIIFIRSVVRPPVARREMSTTVIHSRSEEEEDDDREYELVQSIRRQAHRVLVRLALQRQRKLRHISLQNSERKESTASIVSTLYCCWAKWKLRLPGCGNFHYKLLLRVFG
jgi:hypothetical protein